MRIIKTPTLCQRVFPFQSWRFSPLTNNIYLTFDDGPTENVTDWVLDVLKKAQFTATFFCIGKNVQKNPLLFERIRNEGHAIGNHTMNHLNGWKTRNEHYLADVEKAAQLIDSPLFRPPYGKIKRSQQKMLQNTYKVIMWTHLSWDFDASANMDKIFRKLIRNIRPGDIIVFHDSLKAERQLHIVLPLLMQWMLENKLTSKAIDSEFNQAE
jgi:peptidoglycan/xylan/chitin deacetylase (PgdA/CDA1 family)